MPFFSTCVSGWGKVSSASKRKLLPLMETPSSCVSVLSSTASSYTQWLAKVKSSQCPATQLSSDSMPKPTIENTGLSGPCASDTVNLSWSASAMFSHHESRDTETAVGKQVWDFGLRSCQFQSVGMRDLKHPSRKIHDSTYSCYIRYSSISSAKIMFVHIFQTWQAFADSLSRCSKKTVRNFSFSSEPQKVHHCTGVEGPSRYLSADPLLKGERA